MPVPSEIAALSDHVAERTRQRLSDLTNEELEWVPFETSWHAAAKEGGLFRYDLEVPPPEPPPFTTLAWRLFHLMGCYSADRNAILLNLRQGRDPLMRRANDATTAVAAVELLAACQRVWRNFLQEVTDETLESPLGDKAGDYGHATGLDLVLHQIDEQIHHGAELGLLRDQFRAQRLHSEPDRPAQSGHS